MALTADADVNALLEGWEATHPTLVDGTAWVAEVQLCSSSVSGPDPAELWGAELPDDVSVTCDTAALLSTIRQAGYLAIGAEEFVRVPIEAARANILLDRSVVVDEEAAEMPEYMRDGGIWLAFAHASLANEDGSLRDDYRLADGFGARYDGPVAFDTEATRVTVTGDSIWAPQYSPPNVIDGAPTTFWASVEAGPMPHWVEIAFTKPRTVGRAEVACRPGFLLQDFEVQCKVGDEWKTRAEVTDNEEWVIDCPFDASVETEACRLFVKRESINGENRVIADVGEFTLFDENDVPLIVPPYRIEAQITDKRWARANRSNRLVLRSPAVRISPTNAKVLATFPDPLSGAALPFCTVKRLGKGRAYLFAVPEAAFGYEPEAWEPLLRTFVGMPMIRHSGDEKVCAFLRRGKGSAILHVIDTAPIEGPERAKEVIVRVNTRAFGPVEVVELAPEGTALETRARDRWVQFTAPMDPMATVLLRGKR